MIDGKIGFSRVAPDSYFSTEKKILEPQFMFMPYTVSYSSRIIKRSTVDYGAGIGLISKNNFNKFHLSWKRDQVSYEVESYFRGFNSDTHDGFYGLLRRQYHRITFDYSTKIIKKASFVSSWLNIGLGAATNNNSYNKTDVHLSYTVNVAPNTVLKEIYLQPFSERRVNTFFQIGLENDFNLHKKYFLTLNILFVQGFGELSRVDYVNSYTKNNEIELYRRGLTSKGSGFYLGISRRFQVFPKKIKSS